jgi:hypothetical protein
MADEAGPSKPAGRLSEEELVAVEEKFQIGVSCIRVRLFGVLRTNC